MGKDRSAFPVNPLAEDMRAAVYIENGRGGILFKHPTGKLAADLGRWKYHRKLAF